MVTAPRPPPFTDSKISLAAVLELCDRCHEELPVEETQTIAKPEELDLRVFPNPFNSSVRISVGARHAVPVQIEIYDIAGKRVAEIPLDDNAHGREAQKNRQCRWQPAPSVPSGVYLVRAKMGNSETTRKVVYLK